MLIAQEKKKSNLAEYILYMWQVEDIIRAYQLDIEAIEETVIKQFKQEGEKHQEIKNWYENLIEMMKIENVTKKGHLQIIKNNIDELFDYHIHLINIKKDAPYLHLYEKAAGNISEFKVKAKAGDEVNDIEACLTALYGTLMLRLQKKDISKETLAAVSTFSEMLASLTDMYKTFEEEKE